MAPAPKKTLAKEPVVESENDVDMALCELSWIKSEEGRIKSDLQGAVTKLKQEAAQRMTTKRMSFADRAASLTAAIVNYATAARDRMLSGLSGKTRKMDHGELSYKSATMSVAIKDQTMLDEHIATLKDTLVASLRRQRSGGLPSNELFDIEIKPAKSRILGLYKQQRIDQTALSELGLEIPPQDEIISVKTYQYASPASSSSGEKRAT